jgi:adenine/guanine phosphoribosyltransferase-like PRPP-binding protein
VIRKEDEESHSCYRTEYNFPKTWSGDKLNYVIVDDLIASGDTLNAIGKNIRSAIPQAKCAGVVFYNEEQNHDTSTLEAVMNCVEVQFLDPASTVVVTA